MKFNIKKIMFENFLIDLVDLFLIYFAILALYEELSPQPNYRFK